MLQQIKVVTYKKQHISKRLTIIFESSFRGVSIDQILNDLLGVS